MNTISTAIASLGLPWITAIVSSVGSLISLGLAGYWYVKARTLRKALSISLVRAQQIWEAYWTRRYSHDIANLRAQLAIHEVRKAKQRAGAAKGRASDKRRAG